MRIYTKTFKEFINYIVFVFKCFKLSNIIHTWSVASAKIYLDIFLDVSFI